TAPQQPSTVVILSEGRSPQSKDPEESHIASAGRTILPQSSASPNQQPETHNQQPATCFSPRITAAESIWALASGTFPSSQGNQQPATNSQQPATCT
ncbi:MAG TPA: hypothetical protein VF865_15320, partial [Acidobacteriaceae bacterium]